MRIAIRGGTRILRPLYPGHVFIHMLRRLSLLCRLLLAAAWFAPAAMAAPEKGPADVEAPKVYLQGHVIMQDGEKLEKAGNLTGAYVKYQRARDLFDSVAHSFPGWNREVVDYRRRKIREDMKRVWDSEMNRRKSAEGSTPPAVPPPSTEPVRRDAAELLQERLRTLQEQFDSLTKRNETVLKELGQREGELVKLRRELESARASESDLRARLSDARTQIATAGAAERRKNETLSKRVAELESMLDETTRRQAESNARIESLVADLVKAYADLRERDAESESLRQERDDLLALMNAEGPKATDKLRIVAENQRLRKELEAAKQTIAELSAAKKADEETIASLRGQLRSVQDELAAFRQENADYRAQISALTARLDETSRRLAESAGSALPEAAAIAENGVLREIILQQMKQQAKRERAHENLMAELNREGVLDAMRRNGVEADTLLRALNDMAAAVPLTPKQRSVIAGSGFEQILSEHGVGDLIVVQDSQALRDSSGDAEAGASAAATGATTKEELPPELKAYANAAEEFFRQGAWEEAENQFNKILLVERKNIYALCNLGIVQLRRGKLDEAAFNLRKALAWEFDWEAAHHALAIICLQQGRLEEAEESLQDCLRIRPDHAPARYALGLIALKRKDWDRAESELKQAVAARPDFASAHLNLAILYAYRQKLNLAERHYRLALRNGADRSPDLDKLLNHGTLSSR